MSLRSLESVWDQASLVHNLIYLLPQGEAYQMPLVPCISYSLTYPCWVAGFCCAFAEACSELFPVKPCAPGVGALPTPILSDPD